MIGSVTTAQETFATMIRSEIAPALRSIGFRGSGSHYVRPDDDWWLLVGFQKSRHSDSHQVHFTVNVAALEKRSWSAAHETDPWLPETPSPNTNYPVGEWIRIGNLLPTRHDRWWAVTAGRSTTAIAAEVVAAIRDRAVPWLVGRSGSPFG
jgi:uncharacterized protein DUF4304